MPDEQNSRFIILLLVADRVGILRDISAAISQLGGNIDGITQTVLDDYFTVTLTTSFPAGLNESHIRNALARKLPSPASSLVVQPYCETATPLTSGPTEQYVLTLFCKEKQDIIPPLTAVLAEKRVNIDDWHMETATKGLTHMAELSVPTNLDTKQLHDELRSALQGIDVLLSLQHENIFRATNDIAPVSPLLQEHARHA